MCVCVAQQLVGILGVKITALIQSQDWNLEKCIVQLCACIVSSSLWINIIKYIYIFLSVSISVLRISVFRMGVALTNFLLIVKISHSHSFV